MTAKNPDKDPAAPGNPNPPPNPPAKIKARVLVDCCYGKVNDVVEIPAGIVSRQLDANPAAVAHALGLKKA